MNQVVVKQEKSGYQIVEAYKSLRTNLQFCGEDKKVIAVTSCTPNEGKSSVTFNLSVSLAEAGKKVIMIDADMRKSVLVGRYKVGSVEKGLAHYLTGQNTFDEVCMETDIDGMDIIFSGNYVPNPAELLGSENFETLMKFCREKYDYVIVDTPPLGSVIDSAIAAKYADGAVIVIEADAINYHFVQDVKKQLDKSGVRILGTVLNKVPVKTGKYGYGNYGYGNYGEY